jgi:hypothetical protein
MRHSSFEMEDAADGTKPAGRALAELAVVIAFYLYFAGWVYASDMFAEFGISLGVTDIPAYYFIVYSYGVFFRSPVGWLVLLVVATCWFVLGRIPIPRVAEWLLAIMLVTIPFPVIRMIAARRAVSDAAYVRDGHAKTLQFSIRAEKREKYTAESVTTLEHTKYRLILQTKDRYFVFVQPPDEAKILPAAKVYDLPTEDLIAVIDLRDTKED